MNKKRAEAQLMEREAELEELRRIADSYALLRRQIAELQASSRAAAVQLEAEWSKLWSESNVQRNQEAT
ncbi:hypothetical protein D3C78_1743270 [compost metagenome]